MITKWKKKQILILLLTWGLMMFLVQINYAQEPELYKKLGKIKLFESNKQNIEELFKYLNLKESSKDSGIQTVYYDLYGATLTVGYSTGKCSQHLSPLGYNVRENIIINVDIFFFKPIKMSEFKFDLGSYEKYKGSDNDSVTYSNDYLGIKIDGSEKDISGIEFYPTTSQEKKYKCTNLK